MLLRVASCVVVLSLPVVTFAEDAPAEPAAAPASSEPPLDIPSGMTLGFTLGGVFATAGIAGMVATLDAFPEGERGDGDAFTLAMGFSIVSAITGVTLTGVTVWIGVDRISEAKAVVGLAPVPGGAALSLRAAF